MTPPPRRHRGRAAALTLVLVGGLAVTACGTDGPTGHPTPGPSSRVDGLVGPTWQVAHVRDATVDVDVPATLGATVTLRPDGTFVDVDGVNTTSGRYTLTAHGFVPSDASSTTVGSTDADQVQTATVDAINAVCNGTEVVARVDGDALTLRVDTTEIDLHATR